MAADEEHRLEVPGLAGEGGERDRVLPEGFVLGEEVLGDFVFGGLRDGLWLEGGEAAFGRGDGDVGVRGEDGVGVGELRLVDVLDLSLICIRGTREFVM